MKVGANRLTIPWASRMARCRAPPDIPPKADLVFEIRTGRRSIA